MGFIVIFFKILIDVEIVKSKFRFLQINESIIRNLQSVTSFKGRKRNAKIYIFKIKSL